MGTMNDESKAIAAISRQRQESVALHACVCVCVWVVEWCVRACVCVCDWQWWAVPSADCCCCCSLGAANVAGIQFYVYRKCSLRIRAHTQIHTRTHVYEWATSTLRCILRVNTKRYFTDLCCLSKLYAQWDGNAWNLRNPQIFYVTHSRLFIPLIFFFSFLFLFLFCCDLARSHSVANKLCDPLINVTFRLIVVKAGVCREGWGT